MKVSIIIPNWNGEHFLKACLDSLSKQTFKDLEIILIDNGSVDGSVHFISKNYPSIKLIKNLKNEGFARAVNQGIKASDSKYIVFLNNDTEIDENFISALVVALEKNQNTYFATAKMIKFDHREYLDGAGDGLDWYGFSYKIGQGKKDSEEFNKEVYVLGADGGAAIYKRSMLNKIGLLDEDFFAYFEDLDLSLRAQIAGFKCLYVPDAVVYHVGHGSSKKMGNFAFRMMVRNRIITIIKNIPAKLLFKHFHQLLYGQLRIALRSIIEKQLLAYLQGLMGSLILLPGSLRKRKKIQASRKVPIQYLDCIILNSHQFRRGLFDIMRLRKF